MSSGGAAQLKIKSEPVVELHAYFVPAISFF
jgi:hypothetical protein